MSYAISAGGHRLTSGQDVLGGVDVPVMPDATGRALPRSGAKAQRREQVPTGRAGLAAGVPAVDHHELAAVALALVLELAAELAPAAVADGLGELTVPHHVLDGKILDHDQVVLADQPGARPVEEVLAGVADLAV